MCGSLLSHEFIINAKMFNLIIQLKLAVQVPMAGLRRWFKTAICLNLHSNFFELLHTLDRLQ